MTKIGRLLSTLGALLVASPAAMAVRTKAQLKRVTKLQASLEELSRHVKKNPTETGLQELNSSSNSPPWKRVMDAFQHEDGESAELTQANLIAKTGLDARVVRKLLHDLSLKGALSFRPYQAGKIYRLNENVANLDDLAPPPKKTREQVMAYIQADPKRVRAIKAIAQATGQPIQNVHTVVRRLINERQLMNIGETNGPLKVIAPAAPKDVMPALDALLEAADTLGLSSEERATLGATCRMLGQIELSNRTPNRYETDLIALAMRVKEHWETL